ncbi:hypothetical protein, partial [Butyricimonas virosa]|uniref:hypothetical protein n=1 Tax=Butyricimonas virosa TaxID=544645 RepID=UPI0026650F9D
IFHVWQVEKNPIHTRRTVSLPTGLEPTSLKCFKDNIGKKTREIVAFIPEKNGYNKYHIINNY